MYKIGICDDDIMLAGRMEKIILEICRKENIDADVEVFFERISLEKEILLGIRYDLLYLGIQMDNGDGILTIKSIRKIDDNVLPISEDRQKKIGREYSMLLRENIDV